jgi:hypothetical protein
VDGTDNGGVLVAAIADAPAVMTDGNWRLGMFVTSARPTSRWRS